MTYEERRDAHVAVAYGQLEMAETAAEDHQYGVAASSLRAAADAMERAGAEQQCMDMVADSRALNQEDRP